MAFSMKKSTKAVQQRRIEAQLDLIEKSSNENSSKDKKPIPKKPFGGSTPGIKMQLSTHPRLDTR